MILYSKQFQDDGGKHTVVGLRKKDRLSGKPIEVTVMDTMRATNNLLDRLNEGGVGYSAKRRYDPKSI